MHILALFSMRNRALIALVTIVAAIFGFISLGSLKQELIPAVELPQVTIASVYRGASPDIVATDVSNPIESAISGIPGLDSTSSTSSTGLSIVTASFSYGTDLTFAQNKLQIAVNRIQSTLPDGVTPTILAFSTSDIPVMTIAVSGASDQQKLSDDVTRSILGAIKDVKGVRDATLIGDVGQRISITPDVAKLAARGLSTQAISSALSQNGVLIPGGTVDQDGKTYAIQIGARIGSLDDLRSLPLLGAGEPGLPAAAGSAGSFAGAASANLTVPTLGEVATVERIANPSGSIARVNGEKALTISVSKLSSANTVDVSNALKAALPKLQLTLAETEPNVKLQAVFDQAPFIQRSIDDLSREGLLGLVFAIVVILVFLLSIRSTLVTAISIPTSVLITFIGMLAFGYSLNILTLGALTIAIGRVVDDAIVVIENIKRHLIEGADRQATIVRATREVAGAITAATLTTVAVFLPLALVSGITGELFRPFALTVTISLLASLFVALTIVPVLAYWFLRPADRGRAVDAEDGALIKPTALQRVYLPVIRLTLRRGAATLITAALLLVGTMALVPLLKTNFIGDSGQNTLTIQQTLPVGTSLAALDTASKKVESTIRDTAGVQIVQTGVGGGGQGFAGLLSDNSNRISYNITTDPKANQPALQQQLRDALAALGDGVGRISFVSNSSGFGGSNITIKVQAGSDADLRAATQAVAAAMAPLDGVQEVSSNLSDSRDYVQVVVDRAKAAKAGLSEVALASIVSARTQPAAIGEIVIDQNRLRVYLSPSSQPTSREEIAAILVTGKTGVQRLDALATVRITPGPTTVTTEKSQRTAEVTVVPKSDNVGALSAAVAQKLAKVDLPKGTSAAIGGVASDQATAFAQLGLALLAAILIVYIIMVATFGSLLQPLLLLASIPFAATGAIGLQLASGVPLGVPSLIGVLMLVGIVVTNAIVLIDLVNRYRADGMALKDAVTAGAARRLRPIVMTALATVFALLPLALGLGKTGGGGGFISQPLAIVVIGGLISSTVLTLVVLPTLYYVVENRRERVRAKRAAKRASRKARGNQVSARGQSRRGRPGGVASPSSGAGGSMGDDASMSFDV